MSLRGRICTTAPLTCPGHMHALAQCTPRTVEVTEIDVISRQVPSLGQAYLHLAEAVYVADPAPAETTINSSLLLDVLAFLDRNPDRWTQHRYLSEVDGVLVGCIAGWAVVMGGIRPSDPDFVLSSKDGMELHRMGREVLGFTEFQAGAVFGYTHAYDPGIVRHPHFTELCDLIFEVTNIRYVPQGAAA